MPFFINFKHNSLVSIHVSISNYQINFLFVIFFILKICFCRFCVFKLRFEWDAVHAGLLAGLHEQLHQPVHLRVQFVRVAPGVQGRPVRRRRRQGPQAAEPPSQQPRGRRLHSTKSLCVISCSMQGVRLLQRQMRLLVKHVEFKCIIDKLKHAVKSFDVIIGIIDGQSNLMHFKWMPLCSVVVLTGVILCNKCE